MPRQGAGVKTHHSVDRARIIEDRGARVAACASGSGAVSHGERMEF